jgi:hypothetical protein
MPLPHWVVRGLQLPVSAAAASPRWKATLDIERLLLGLLFLPTSVLALLLT